MNRSVTRLCLPLLAAVLAAAVAGPAQAQGLKYLPSDTEVIISLNMAQVWDSKLAKDYGAVLKQLEGLFNTKLDGNEVVAEIKKSLGIDPFKDIKVVTIGMSEMGQKPKNAVIVLEGKFNPQKFTDTLTKQAKDNPEVVKSVTIGNTTVYQLTKPGDESSYVALLNNNTVVMAKTKDAMTAAVNAQASSLKKEMTTLLQSASLKKSLNVVVTNAGLKEAIKNNAQAAPIASIVDDMEGAVITANVISDIDLHVEYIAKNEAAAKGLTEKINQGVAVMKFALAGKAKTDPNAAASLEIINSLKVSAQGTTVTINGTVSRKILDEAVKKIENFLP